LAAVFAHTRNVSFDVTGIQRRSIERWLEKLNQSRISSNQVPVNCRHGHSRAFAGAGAG
jgi:type II secretory pathway component PulL